MIKEHGDYRDFCLGCGHVRVCAKCKGRIYTDHPNAICDKYQPEPSGDQHANCRGEA